MILTIAGIMTRQVIGVPPEAMVTEIPEVLAPHDLSAAPVCEDYRLLGIASWLRMERNRPTARSDLQRPI
jgi:CBS-domain-containing membrane protein